MNHNVKTVFFWMVMVVSAVLLWQVVKSGNSPHAVPEISYSDFLARIVSGQVSAVVIAGSVVNGMDTKHGSFRVIAPPNQTPMLDTLQQHGVNIRFRQISEQSQAIWILNLAPLVLLGALWYFMIRQTQKRRSSEDRPSDFPLPQESKPRFGP
jgi:cell division protease FtsH